jgi:hypothetical protein
MVIHLLGFRHYVRLAKSEIDQIGGAEMYKGAEEAGSIYFFDRRETSVGGKLKKPVRAARGGGWKASGGGKALTTKKHGGSVVGYRLTLVFYEHLGKQRDKTEWAIKEYTTIEETGDKVTLNHRYPFVFMVELMRCRIELQGRSGDEANEIVRSPLLSLSLL